MFSANRSWSRLMMMLVLPPDPAQAPSQLMSTAILTRLVSWHKPTTTKSWRFRLWTSHSSLCKLRMMILWWVIAFILCQSSCKVLYVHAKVHCRSCFEQSAMILKHAWYEFSAYVSLLLYRGFAADTLRKAMFVFSQSSCEFERGLKTKQTHSREHR